MSDRFFVEKPIANESARLLGQEAQHLLKVLRAKIGDEIIVFDGTGDEFLAKVAGASRSAVELEIVERRHIDRELPFQLTMGVALPKGDRQRWLVEKLTELGVTRLVPLLTTRGVAQPIHQAIDRLRRFVIEASKQCGRNQLMAIGEPQSCAAFFAATPAEKLRFIAHPLSSAKPLQTELNQRDVAIAIGPEGGFTEEEVSRAAEKGWQCVELGSRILRVETAAIAAAAMVSLGRSNLPQSASERT